LCYVQGDILRPPFRDGSFRVLVSIGVWHSTGDTRHALLNSVRLLEKSGFLSAWLYPNLKDIDRDSSAREYRMWRRYYFFRDRLLLGRAHHLCPNVLFGVCKALSLAISPFSHLLHLQVPRLQDRYRSNTFILFDDLSPEFQDRPRKAMILNWFREAGASKVVY